MPFRFDPTLIKDKVDPVQTTFGPLLWFSSKSPKCHISLLPQLLDPEIINVYTNYRTRFFNPNSTLHIGTEVVPAVDDDGSGVWNGALGAVDLLQEPEDAAGLIGHPVVRPAQVLVVPDVPQRLLLQENDVCV